MSVSESGRRYGWTVATILVAGIVIGFFIYSIATFLQYGFASVLNVTVMIQEAASGLVQDNVSVSTTTVRFGNYTATVARPSNEVMATAHDYVFPIVAAIMHILSDPRLLAIVVAVSLVVAALSMRHGNEYGGW